MTHIPAHKFWHDILNSKKSNHFIGLYKLFLYRPIKDSFKGHFQFLGYQPFIKRCSSLEKDIRGLKRKKV